MLEFIEIQNFQGLSALRFKIDPQTTTIIGPTDSCKSATLRALRWLATNTPGGDGFIKDGETEARVTLGIDGHRITRIRSKSENAYELDGKKFVAFGTGVPEPIAEVLRVGAQNFQGQHDPVFWLQSSAGEVSRQLNAIVDLGIIDKALSEIGSKVRAATAAVQVSNDRLAAAKERKAALSWVVAADVAYSAVEALEGALLGLRDQRQTLGGMLTTVRDLMARRKMIREEVDAVRELGRLGMIAIRFGQERESLAGMVTEIKRLQAAQAVVPNMGDLELLLLEWMRLNRDRVELQKTLKKVRELESAAKTEIPDLFRVESALSDYNQVRNDRIRLGKVLDSLKDKAERYRAAKIEAVEAEGELDDQAGDLCPVCGRDGWDHGH